MEIRKFTLDVAVRDGAPAIDVADAVEEAVKSAHHDVLAVELRFDCGDKSGKAPAAGRKKRKYVRKAKPADPGVSPNAVKVERRGTIPAGANAADDRRGAMTFADMTVVERYVADLMSGTGRQLPVMLSKEYDRVDIDAKALSSTDACALVDRLAQSLGRKGYLWDVWTDTNDHMVHVAERERETET